MRWEYAALQFGSGAGLRIKPRVSIQFSHRPPVQNLPGELFAALRWMGDQGWEMMFKDSSPEINIYSYWFKRPLGGIAGPPHGGQMEGTIGIPGPSPRPDR
jgi:hypothetical protein